MHEDHVPVSFVGKRLPPAFERRVVVLAAGMSRSYDRADWQDAIVVVERGQVEIRLCCGERQRFGRGAVVWFDGLPIRTLHNQGSEPAVLVAVSRRRG